MAVLGMVTYSYVVFYLFFLEKMFFFSSVDFSNSILSAYYSSTVNPTTMLDLNSAMFNWFVLIFFFLFMTIQFSSSFKHLQLFDLYSSLFVFLLFFFMYALIP